MDIKWNGEIGPASLVGIVGSLSILVTIGVLYGNMNTKLDTTTATAFEAKAAAVIAQNNESSQAERLGRVETAVNFIVPTLQRIEAKLERPGNFSGWPPGPTSPLTPPAR